MSFTLEKCEKHGKFFDIDGGEQCPHCEIGLPGTAEEFGPPLAPIKCEGELIVEPGMVGYEDPVTAWQPVPGYPDDNPKTKFGMAKIPLHLVPPSAIHALALGFSDGAPKYGPFNWREKTISSTVYYGAVLRHLTAWYDGEDLAPDSGKPHLAHAMACLAMIIDGQSVGKLNDNRPPKGASARMQAEYAAQNKDVPTFREQLAVGIKHLATSICSDCGVDLEEQAHAASCLRNNGRTT